ncbi:MAG: hypothetical protein FJY56_04110 [Betaproteobacteria bacterium]|nr:hypothetical protein [Betaproteobacteria bacterium]
MEDNTPPPSTPLSAAVKPPKRGALLPALLAVGLPIAAFALAWAIAGKIPLAVPKAEWGTWFVIGALMGVAGVAGVVFAIQAFVRGGYRSLAVAGLLLSLAVVLMAWAGLFA